MNSLKSIAPILLATNPNLVSAFSLLPSDNKSPDMNKNTGQNVDKFVKKPDVSRKKWDFMDGLEDKAYGTNPEKNNTKAGTVENQNDIIQGVVCKDGVCYLSFGDEKSEEVKQNNNGLFVVDDSSSFVSKYAKKRDDNQEMQR